MSFYDNKIIVVTGAASGIGASIAETFQAAGSLVVGLDRQATKLAAVETQTVDVTIEAEVMGAFSMVEDRHGRVDVLVNCAGVLLQENTLATFDPVQFDQIFDINVKAMMLVTREALRLMPKGSRIINIASELAFLGRADAPIYAASKGAIISLTRSWARQLAPDILVNAVAPGATRTPMLRWDALSEAEREAELDNPLRRLAEPREIAEAVKYLAGEWAGYVTGQVLSVDGGAAMH